MRSRGAALVGLFLILANLSCAWAQSPLPALRGIVLTHSGQGRAYFEDPQTGVLGVYAVGDFFGDNRIEEIQDDYVILRRGEELFRVVMGSSPGSVASSTDEVVTDSQPEPRPLQRAPAPAVMPVYRPNPSGGPTIGNGQPYLDRLGIPPQALSRAIEEALPPQDPDSDNIKD